MKLTLTSSEAETPAIRTLTFGPAAGGILPGFSAGAHVEFDLGALGTRSYSLVDWTGDTEAPETYVFGIQREPDGQGGSAAMHALEPGTEIEAGAPKNDFPLDPDAPALLMAGGIGLTPMISMAARLRRDGRAFELHHASRSAELAAYGPGLRETFGDRFHPHFDDTAMIDLARVIAARPTGAHVYVCGPKGMIEATKTAAEAVGLAPGEIHFELFTTAPVEAKDAPFEVEVNSGEVYVVPPGQSIIEVLEANGVDLMYDCQRGDCGICQTEIVSGVPDHRDVVLSQAERDGGKVMQICVSRAKSPRLVLDI